MMYCLAQIKSLKHDHNCKLELRCRDASIPLKPNKKYLKSYQQKVHCTKAHIKPHTRIASTPSSWN